MAITEQEIERFERLGEKIQREIQEILQIIEEHIARVAKTEAEATQMREKVEEEFRLLLDIFEDDEEEADVESLSMKIVQ